MTKTELEIALKAVNYKLKLIEEINNSNMPTYTKELKINQIIMEDD
jgi:hypothetical protein